MSQETHGTLNSIKHFKMYTQKGENFLHNFQTWMEAKIEHDPLFLLSQDDFMRLQSTILEQAEFIDGMRLSDETYSACASSLSHTSFAVSGAELRSYKEKWEHDGQPVSLYSLFSPKVPRIMEHLSQIQTALNALLSLGVSVTAMNQEARNNPSLTDGYDIVLSKWSGGFFNTEHLEVTINGNGECAVLSELIGLNNRETALKELLGGNYDYAKIIQELSKINHEIGLCNYTRMELSTQAETSKVPESLSYQLSEHNGSVNLTMTWRSLSLDCIKDDIRSLKSMDVPLSSDDFAPEPESSLGFKR